LALTHKEEEALTLLRDAVDHGVDADAAEELKKSPDWKSLRGDARFEALVVQAQGRIAASSPKPN
jgi:hypothetical protein